MSHQKFFDLPWIDILATAHNHVLDATNDIDETLRIHHRDIACVHPSMGIDRSRGGLWILPVAQHHRIAASA